jgi:hypothetical protein
MAYFLDKTEGLGTMRNPQFMSKCAFSLVERITLLSLIFNVT